MTITCLHYLVLNMKRTLQTCISNSLNTCKHNVEWTYERTRHIDMHACNTREICLQYLLEFLENNGELFTCSCTNDKNDVVIIIINIRNDSMHPAESWPEYYFLWSLKEPCEDCGPPYGFHNQLPLTDDTDSFTVCISCTK